MILDRNNHKKISFMERIDLKWAPTNKNRGPISDVKAERSFFEKTFILIFVKET